MCIRDRAGEELRRAALFPAKFYRSVQCKKAEAEDFVLRAGRPCAGVRVNVMKIGTFGTFTEHVTRDLRVENGEVCWQEAGLSLAVLFERYGKNGNVAFGLVEGAFKGKGAAATTWCHDSHNLLVLGTDPEDMAAAQNLSLIHILINDFFDFVHGGTPVFYYLDV